MAAPAPSVTHPCGHCGIPAKNLCTRCRGVRYCSVTCQKEAWPAHSKVCVAVRTYAVPPDEQRCAGCRGWGKSLLHADKGGRCLHCWAQTPEGAAAAAAAAAAVGDGGSGGGGGSGGEAAAAGEGAAAGDS